MDFFKIGVATFAGVLMAMILAGGTDGGRLGNYVVATPTHSTVEAAAASSTTVLAANGSRQYAKIVNTDANVVWCAYGAAAAADNGEYLTASGGSLEIKPDNLGNIWRGKIECSSVTSSSTMATTEF